MVYCGTYNTEAIVVRLNDDENDKHLIMLTKEYNTAMFSVHVCCYDDWEWKFSLASSSHYEMVKYRIMDAAFQAEDMDELIMILDEIFENDFLSIVVDESVENTHECDECCENCNHRDCLN